MSIYYKGKKLSEANHYTVEQSIEGITINGDSLTITDSPYQYVNINQQGTVYVQNSTLLDIHASTYIRGVYDGATVTATNLTPENIKKGVTILGVTGTYEG